VRVEETNAEDGWQRVVGNCLRMDHGRVLGFEHRATEAEVVYDLDTLPDLRRAARHGKFCPYNMITNDRDVDLREYGSRRRWEEEGEIPATSLMESEGRATWCRKELDVAMSEGELGR
jgi:hypothetical protein